MIDLDAFVRDFATAMSHADSKRPVAVSQRSGRAYLPGIGPHGEDRAVDLTLAEVVALNPTRCGAIRCRVPYPDSRRACDLLIGHPPEWAIEVKMARPNGDNGKPDDTATKDILSPYDVDHSAVSDYSKLAASVLAPRKAILIYGFEDVRRPLDAIIDAFEVLARERVHLGARQTASLGILVHPIHSAGRVFAWEIAPLKVNGAEGPHGAGAG